MVISILFPYLHLIKEIIIMIKMVIKKFWSAEMFAETPLPMEQVKITKSMLLKELDYLAQSDTPAAAPRFYRGSHIARSCR